MEQDLSVRVAAPDSGRTALRMLRFWLVLPAAVLLISIPSGGSFFSKLVVPGLMAAFAVWRAWRASTVSVTVSPGGIVIRNVTRTHRLEWSQVRQIAIDVSDPPNVLLQERFGISTGEDPWERVPEHRKVFDDTENTMKYLVSISVQTDRRSKVPIDAVCSDVIDAVIPLWVTYLNARNEKRIPTSGDYIPSEDAAVISADELAQWFAKPSSDDAEPHH